MWGVDLQIKKWQSEKLQKLKQSAVFLKKDTLLFIYDIMVRGIESHDEVTFRG